MTVRAFFALTLQSRFRRSLEVIGGRLKAEPGAERLAPRWVSAEQMHVTLKFLGDVEPATIDKLTKLAEEVACESPVIEARLSHLDQLGRPGRARVLVVAITEDRGHLRRLGTAIDRSAERVGIPREQRPFRPHVTLARFKRAGDATALARRSAFLPILVRFDELVLFESTLAQSGAQYTPLAAFPLGGEKAPGD